MEIRTLKVGRYVALEDSAYKILSMSKSKPGKHGSAKARLELEDIFTGQKKSHVGTVTDSINVPIIEKGSAISFNLHFNKEPGVGTAFNSQPEIGFWVEKNPVQHEVINDTLYNRGFEIPPNHANYRVGSSRLLEKDTLVLTYWPHAHLRATAARYTAIFPDGNEEVLLNVPNYDQGWQITYKYKEPKFLPKGTRLDVDFWYDNTAERAARRGFNPDRFVGYGARTYDEMSLGFIGYAEITDAEAMETTDDN